jgi:hypothetical protein
MQRRRSGLSRAGGVGRLNRLSCLRRQDVRPESGRDLLGQRVIILGQQAVVQGALDLRNPLVVEIVKDPHLDACPIMDRHDGDYTRLSADHSYQPKLRP